MPEPLTISTGLALTALGGFAWDAFKGAWGDVVHQPLQKLLDAVAMRFAEGSLPPNRHLDRALVYSIGAAARALAYHLHDPARGPMSALLENVSSWPNFVHRFAEIGQSNILARTPCDHWLSQLIDASKDPNNFEDFPLSPVLKNNQVYRVVGDEADVDLREHVHREFLAWVDRHVPDNGNKPSHFTTAVKQGWPTSGQPTSSLNFYVVFCLFFRETLKEEAEVFRAFSISLLTGLQKNIDEIKHILPDPASLRRFEEVLRTFEDKNFNANYSHFKAWTRKQNETLLQALRTEFAAVHHHLASHGMALAEQTDEIKGARKEIRETNQRIANLEKLFSARLQEPMRSDDVGPGLDFPRALREWATIHGVTPEQAHQEVAAWIIETRNRSINLSERAALNFSRALREWATVHGVTPDQAHQEVEAWITETRNRSIDLSERALAEFLAHHFTESARLYDQAFEAKLSRSRVLDELVRRQSQESRQLMDGAVTDLTHAGEALHAKGNHAEAIARFSKALDYVSSMADANRWASLQIWIGLCHWRLSASCQVDEAGHHLGNAMVAYREALKVYTPEQSPQSWAAAHNYLGVAYNDQARLREGTEPNLLLSDAVSAYREALKVYTREQSPQDRAATLTNLAIALRDQARLSEGARAVELLSEAVSACREALEIYTPEQSPHALAMTQYYLSIALCERAFLPEGKEALKLLSDAVSAYREALKVYTREQSPQDRAATLTNLATALRDQARLSEGARAVELLSEAVSACREALEIYTRFHTPQAWAAIQNCLGAALTDQSRLSEGEEALKLLSDAAFAHREALKVYTRVYTPQDWAMTHNNLGIALLNQGSLSECPEAVSIFGEAVNAFMFSLSVYKAHLFPDLHHAISMNLGCAELKRICARVL